MKSLLASDEARRLWWLVHNHDHDCVVRERVYNQLIRGYLNVPLNEQEIKLCAIFCEAEKQRLAEKADEASQTVDRLIEFLGTS